MTINKQTRMSKSFFIMVIGQVISIFGSALLRFGFSLYVLDMTGREDIFATLLAASFLPQLLTPIGGALADRFNRRNLMVLVDSANTVLTLVFILLLILDMVTIPLIGVIMVLLGLVGALEQPTCSASVPNLVSEESLEAANGIVSGIGAVSGLIAPIAGGVLYGALGLELLTVICCVAFFIAAVMECFIKMPFKKRKFSQNIFSTITLDLKDGVRYVISQSLIIKAMIMAALLNFLLTPFFIVGTPITLRLTMGSSDAMYGIGMSLFELATILGALSIGFISKKLKIGTIYRWLIVIAVLLMPMGYSLTQNMLNNGFYPSFILYFICAIPIAMILTMLSIYLITIVQKKTPNEMMGKVMAIITAVAHCAAPIGQILYGFAFKQFSSSVYAITFALGVAIFLVACFVRVTLRNETEV